MKITFSLLLSFNKVHNCIWFSLYHYSLILTKYTIFSAHSLGRCYFLKWAFPFLCYNSPVAVIRIDILCYNSDCFFDFGVGLTKWMCHEWIPQVPFIVAIILSPIFFYVSVIQIILSWEWVHIILTAGGGTF